MVDTAAQAIAESIGTVVGAAVAASVSSAVASSVASSVAASASVPAAPPVSLLTMISSVQVMNMKNTLPQPPTMAAMTDMNWINLNIDPPFMSQGDRTRRRLLAVAGSRSLGTALNLLFWFAAVLVPGCMVHYGIHVYRVRKHGKKGQLGGLIGFPQLELFLAAFLLNSFASAAAAMFRIGTPGSVLLGIGLLGMLPIPLVLGSAFVIYKYVLKERTVQFFVTHALQTCNSPVSFIRRGLFSNNSGTWKGNDEILNKYGMFWGAMRGPFMVKLKNVKFDDFLQKYAYTTMALVRDGTTYIRTFYQPYVYLKNVWVALVLGAIAGSTTASQAQIMLLLCTLTGHLCIVIGAVPFNNPREQFAEVVSTVGELGTYAGAWAYTVYGTALSGSAMFYFQMIAIGIHIALQIWLVFDKTGALWGVVEQRFFMDSVIRKTRRRYLQAKYANRWMKRTFGRSLKIMQAQPPQFVR